MKKCYTVSVTLETMIVADSEQEALGLAREALAEDLSQKVGYELDIKPSVEPVDGWNDECLVWTNEPQEISVKEALVLNTKN